MSKCLIISVETCNKPADSYFMKVQFIFCFVFVFFRAQASLEASNTEDSFSLSDTGCNESKCSVSSWQSSLLWFLFTWPLNYFNKDFLICRCKRWKTSGTRRKQDLSDCPNQGWNNPTTTCWRARTKLKPRSVSLRPSGIVIHVPVCCTLISKWLCFNFINVGT